MIKYLLIITVVCAYDIYQIINKGKKTELFVFLFIASLAIALCTLYVSDPVNVSLSDIYLNLVKSPYLKGN